MNICAFHLGPKGPSFSAQEDKDDLQSVAFLLKSGVDVDAANQSGWTALHVAAAGGHIEIARYLIEKRASANSTDNGGRTPLYEAIFFKKSIEMIQLLLEHGADPSISCKDGQTSRDVAADKGYSAVVELLKDAAALPQAGSSSNQG